MVSPNSSRMVSGRWLWIGIVVLLLGYGSIPFGEPLYAGYDLHTYRKMAEAFPSVDFSVPAPFRYRIVGPWLAALLPGPPEWGFRLLSLGGLGLFFFFLSGLFKQYEAAGWKNNLAVFMLAANPYLIGFVSWNYFQITDILGIVCLTGAVWAAHRSKYGWFVLLTVLGAGSREISLAAVPIALALCLRKKDYRAARKFLLLSGPGLLIYFGLRWGLKGGEGYDLGSGVALNLDKVFSWQTYFRGFVNAWIPVLPLPVLLWRGSRDFLKQHWECGLWLLLIFGSSFLAEDQERLLLPLAPVVFLLVCRGLEQLPSRGFTSVLLITGLFTYFHHQIGILNWPGASWTLAVRLGCLVVVAITASAVLLKKD